VPLLMVVDPYGTLPTITLTSRSLALVVTDNA